MDYKTAILKKVLSDWIDDLDPAPYLLCIYDIEMGMKLCIGKDDLCQSFGYENYVGSQYGGKGKANSIESFRGKRSLAHLSDLLEFKEEYGHYWVPRDYRNLNGQPTEFENKRDPHLGEWVNSLRMQNRQGKMNQNLKFLSDGMGFKMDVFDEFCVRFRFYRSIEPLLKYPTYYDKIVKETKKILIKNDLKISGDSTNKSIYIHSIIVTELMPLFFNLPTDPKVEGWLGIIRTQKTNESGKGTWRGRTRVWRMLVEELISECFAGSTTKSGQKRKSMN